MLVGVFTALVISTRWRTLSDTVLVDLTAPIADFPINWPVPPITGKKQHIRTAEADEKEERSNSTAATAASVEVESAETAASEPTDASPTAVVGSSSG